MTVGLGGWCRLQVKWLGHIGHRVHGLAALVLRTGSDSLSVGTWRSVTIHCCLCAHEIVLAETS